MWELLTRGGTPYPDVPNWEVRAYVQAGNRMHRPDACPPEVCVTATDVRMMKYIYMYGTCEYFFSYELMLNCWKKESDKRPTFSDVIATLTEILHPDADEIEAGSDDDYYNLSTGVAATAETEEPVTSGSTGSLTT